MSAVRRVALAAVVALLAGVLTSPAGAAAPEPDLRGSWHVSPASGDRHTLVWRSPSPLPVSDARPEFFLGHHPLGFPRLSSDGRTLTLTVDAREAPAVADLSVVLSGRELDSTAGWMASPGVRTAPGGRPSFAPSAPGPAAGDAARRGVTLPVDPGRPGPHAVVTSEYRLPGTRIAGMPARIEMLGHVVRPASPTEAGPLVVFLHGRHNPCYRTPGRGGRGRGPWPCARGTSPVPSHLGYDYAQRLLASQGYVTVSVAANGINAQDFLLPDGGAAARAVLVRRHLLQWARWAAAGRFDVDLSRVVLVGHSRGGEGVNELTLKTPLTAPFRIVGQVLLAPTNFGRKVAAYVPTVTVLPYCDGDVVDLQGQSYTDLARDLTRDDTALRSSVLVMGANHNFFNTEWTPGISVARSFDDGQFLPGVLCKRGSATRLRPGGQRAAARTYIAGAVALTARDDATVTPMFDGSDVTVRSAGRADVRVHALGGGRELRRPGSQATPDPAGTADTRLCGGRTGTPRPGICGRDMSPVRTPHWLPDFPIFRALPAPPALQMTWARPGLTGGMLLRRPLDLAGSTHLDLRTAVDPVRGPVRLAVTVHDGSGGSALLTPARGRVLRPLPGRNPFVFGRIWAQDLRVPLGPATGVDLTDVRRVELRGLSDRGRVWLLDVAGTRPGDALAPVPRLRLPRVRLAGLRVREGDGRRRRVAQVPFTVRGTVRTPASFVVVGQNFTDGALVEAQRVTLRPGQTRGVVPVPYISDDVDDLRVQPFFLLAFPVRGVAFAHGQALLRIVDDDPSPRVRITRVRPVVHEGGQARWRVTLSRAVDYHVAVPAVVVRGRTDLPRLSVDDVPRAWLRDRYFPLPPRGEPLYRQRPFVFDDIPVGRRQVTLRIPLLRDRVVEGRESVTLRIRLVPRLRTPVERTVTVVD